MAGPGLRYGRGYPGNLQQQQEGWDERRRSVEKLDVWRFPQPVTEGEFSAAYGQFVRCNTGASSVTVLLPKPEAAPGCEVAVKKINPNNTVFVRSALGEKIDGEDSVSWTAKDGFVFVSDGTEWWLT